MFNDILFLFEYLLAGVVYLLFLSGAGYCWIRLAQKYQLHRLKQKLGDTDVTCFNTKGHTPYSAVLVAESIVVSESLIESILLYFRAHIGGLMTHRNARSERYRELLLLKIKLQAKKNNCNEIHAVRFYSSELSQMIKTPIGEKGLLEIMVVGMAVPNNSK